MNVIALASWIALAVAQTAGTPPESIVSQAVVDAPAERVWELFTTKAGMESWMAASGDIEPRVGGRMRTSHQKGADREPHESDRDDAGLYARSRDAEDAGVLRMGEQGDAGCARQAVRRPVIS